MPSPVITPNMSLTEPLVGGTLAPGWALLLNANFTTIDQHNHTPGHGVAIPPGGLDINTDLSFQGNNLTMLNSAVFAGAVSGTPAVLGIYSDGTDFFFKDINGNSIQLTKAGGPNAGTGNIQGLPSSPVGGAGISWVNAQSTFQFLLDAGTVGANADVGTLILRYPGAYPTPSGNFIALQAPVGLATGYALTLPATTSSTVDGVALSDTSGVLSFLALGTANLPLHVNSGGSHLVYATLDTAGITDSAITTAKIADGAVTPVKLSALNTIQSDWSSSSTASSSPQAVSGGSVTLPNPATGIRPVVISLKPRDNSVISNLTLVATGVAAPAGVLRVDVGSKTYLMGFTANFASSTVWGWPICNSFTVLPSAGSLTVTVYIYVTSASTTISLAGGTIEVTEL